MAKKAKAAKAATPAKAADGGAVDPNDTGSNAGGGVGNTVASSLSGLASALNPFGDWFNNLEADFMNILNQIMNSVFFGFCVALGAFGIAWGLYLLFKDTAPVQGAKTVAKTAAMAAAL